ncbi:hypothetical protein QCA50_001088 [Cerrena zonata]|uniref:Uncharacterized protein n=1 Tax=Cerrena zonata TaxID=2478898 RepID=A0AAW0GUX7_9APHY
MSLMQRSNVTVSHLSPMIQYWPSNGWWEDTLEEDEDDQLLQGYSTRTNHRTDGSVQNATATFQWHGEGGIWFVEYIFVFETSNTYPRIFGGYRQRLGNFWVVLNDTKTFIVPGFQPGDKEQAQAVLFSQEDIPFGRHQMQIVNPGGDDDGHGILDLDYIVFQTSAPTTSVPDNSTDISWLPVPPDDKSVVWRQTSNSHYTNQTNAQVEYSFNVGVITSHLKILF